MSQSEGALDVWAVARREKRRNTLLGLTLLLLLLVGSGYVSDFSWTNLLNGLPEVSRYLAATGPDLRTEGPAAGLAEWFWGWKRWLGQLLDTVVIAFLATLMGYVLAVPLSFASAKNLSASSGFRFIARRVLQVARTVPELVFALIFVVAFGLGPVAGVLALGFHSAGSLGKLFTGVNENIDTGPTTGIQAAGGDWFQTMRFGVLPQVLPSFISYTLLRLEINVRSASVVGFVGVGGIGQELYTAVRQFVYPDVGAIVLLIIATVVAIDHLGDHLRQRIRVGEGVDDYRF